METIAEVLTQYGYIGLFIASFLAATILPFASELVFTGLLYASDSNAWMCIWAASIGNFLGGMTCYYIGRLGKIEWIEKYLKVDKEKLYKWVNKIQDKASWAAFFTFLPGIGDIIAIAAGYLRANVYTTCIAMFLGKLIRYIVWVWITYWAFQ